MIYGPMIYASIGMALYALTICLSVDRLDRGWEKTPYTRTQYYAIIFWVVVLLWPALIATTICDMIRDLKRGKT